jgi:hypothetical protein
LDFFGWSVASLRDLDGNGVPDLAVGASDDDDSAFEAGAVWILFMNTDGTVAAHQKISATEGGFTGFLEELDRFGFSVAPLGDLDEELAPRWRTAVLVAPAPSFAAGVAATTNYRPNRSTAAAASANTSMPRPIGPSAGTSTTEVVTQSSSVASAPRKPAYCTVPLPPLAPSRIASPIPPGLSGCVGPETLSQ